MFSLASAYGTTKRGAVGPRGGDHGSLHVGLARELLTIFEGDCTPCDSLSMKSAVCFSDAKDEPSNCSSSSNVGLYPPTVVTPSKRQTFPDVGVLVSDLEPRSTFRDDIDGVVGVRSSCLSRLCA